MVAQAVVAEEATEEAEAAVVTTIVPSVTEGIPAVIATAIFVS